AAGAASGAGRGALAPGRPAVRTLQPEDLFALRSVSDAQPSPDGQHIAYVLTELDRAEDRSRSSIWIARLDGEHRRLTDGARPRWSPDGSRLAYVSDRQVCVVSTESDTRVTLTDVPLGVFGPPVWSPDGARIAFTSRVAPSADANAPRVIRKLRYLLNAEG